ncbi:MAG: hypothetical protein ACQERV_01890 [Bacteroidota bacterium]
MPELQGSCIHPHVQHTFSRGWFVIQLMDQFLQKGATGSFLVAIGNQFGLPQDKVLIRWIP